MGKAQTVGKEAEQRAEHWLARSGLQPVKRNYRCRGGEIDLIMRDGDLLVFVEVRYRADNTRGGALASVSAGKRQRLILAAQHYLQTSGWQGPCRFDVIGFEGGHTQPHWVRDAFGT